MTPTSITRQIEQMKRTAEDGAAWAEICRLDAILITATKLATDKGYSADDVTNIHLKWDDRCEVSSVELGQDDDGMCRMILNFAL
jgi:hypothetical protein